MNIEETLSEIRTQNPIPSNFKKFFIAGDVGATNTLMGVYAIVSENKIIPVTEALYNGQKIGGDFTPVVNHLISMVKGVKKQNIEAMVLCPAGPISPDGRLCDMTNADFSVDASKTGIRTALINDYKAIAYAVATKGLGGEIPVIQLKHTDGSLGERIEGKRIAIHGAGTGLGTSRLEYDEEKRLYFPIDSEGGHKFLAADVLDPVDVGLVKFLATDFDLKLPHLEALLCGNGIERLFKYFVFKGGEDYSIADIEGFRNAEDKSAYVGKKAKQNPDSIFGKAMEYFWKHYGIALHDLAVHENALGGIWVAGGVIRKDLPIAKGSMAADPKIERLIMQAFDSGPSHTNWVNQIPVYAIMDERIGLEGSIQVAANPKYFEKERYKGE